MGATSVHDSEEAYRNSQANMQRGKRRAARRKGTAQAIGDGPNLGFLRAPGRLSLLSAVPGASLLLQ
jgi:hypothetical protein